MNQAVRGVSIADGRMTVDGVTGAFIQAVGRPLALEADGLALVRGHVWREGVRHEANRIEARARPREASLHRAGYPGEAHDIALTIRPFPTEGAQAPLLRLGLSGDTQEAGLDQSYRADLFLPQPLFAELGRDLAASAPEPLHLSLSAATDLWLREAEPEALPGRPLAFHLGLEAASGRSASGHGRVESIEWSRAGPGSAAAPADPDAAAAEADPEEEPDDPVSDQLRRINWSLKQVLIVLAFLMLIVALK